MRKRVTKLEKEAADNEMSVDEYLNLKKTIEDLQSPIRYVIVTNLFEKFRKKEKWKLFLAVDKDVWAQDLESASVFRRKYYAEAIRRIYLSEGDLRKKKRLKGDLVIAKITTKNKKRKILKYYTNE